VDITNDTIAMTSKWE